MDKIFITNKIVFYAKIWLYITAIMVIYSHINNLQPNFGLALDCWLHLVATVSYGQMLLSNCLGGIFKKPRKPSHAAIGIITAANNIVLIANTKLN